ncbi:MAG: hypothetical protein CMF80_02420 [Candidatus Marinimicrobia bacterium]|nr:hypothetical protein [Candidatus Neomarinimicrobiota bacterium]
MERGYNILRLFKLFVVIILIIAFGTLLYQNQILNPDPITIWLYPNFQIQLLLPIILALTFFCGSILGFLIALFQIISEKKDTMSLRTKVKRLQVELDSLRNYAIEDDIDIKDSNASFDVKIEEKVSSLD